MKIDAHIWQFGGGVDYPGAEGDDKKLPLRSVNVKAWDGDHWMSTYDSHGAAISGPAQIAKLVGIYKAQGIELLLWCNPVGRNVSRMLALSKACVDVPGVKGLVFDVEPYAGFCAGDCTYLATTLMKQLRAARPKAWLGVTYDPRPQHWGSSGTTEWLKYANGALPMMYWESFKTNVSPWPDPKASVTQAFNDLRQKLAPGRNIEYFPILQGNTTAAKMTAGMKAALAVGSMRVSVWRRGVVPAATWAAIAAVPEPTPPPPPPPPPPSDCSAQEAKISELEGQIAALQASINLIQDARAQCGSDLTAALQRVAELEVQLALVSGQLANAKKAWHDLGSSLS